MRVRGSLGRVLLGAALIAAVAFSPLAVNAGASAGSSATAGNSTPTESTASSPRLASSAAASAALLSAWRGGMDLYRPGVFTTQKTWYWCTAATVQISRNIVFHRTDHSASAQQAYFDWMRRHDRYALPLAAGVDAAGWAAGFQHFVDGRYRLSTATTFDAALRAAVTNLRRTNLPVALAVDHGNHAWLLTGFTATADPARTSRFTVTSVRVVGPLYGLQSKGGYDMPPDTRLTTTELHRYFTPWYYAPIRMVWDGKFVSIQPSGASSPASAAPKATPSPTPKPAATPKPSAMASPAPSPTLAATSLPMASPVATPVRVASSGPLAAVATGVDPGTPTGAPGAASDRAIDQEAAAATGDPVLLATGVVAALIAAIILIGVVVLGLRRVRPTNGS